MGGRGVLFASFFLIELAYVMCVPSLNNVRSKSQPRDSACLITPANIRISSQSLSAKTGYWKGNNAGHSGHFHPGVSLESHAEMLSVV